MQPRLWGSSAQHNLPHEQDATFGWQRVYINYFVSLTCVLGIAWCGSQHICLKVQCDRLHSSGSNLHCLGVVLTTLLYSVVPQARTLLGVAKKLVELARAGVTDFRGRTAGIVRVHNANIAAEEKADREARRVAVRCCSLAFLSNAVLFCANGGSLDILLQQVRSWFMTRKGGSSRNATAADRPNAFTRLRCCPKIPTFMVDYQLQIGHLSSKP